MRNLLLTSHSRRNNASYPILVSAVLGAAISLAACVPNNGPRPNLVGGIDLSAHSGRASSGGANIGTTTQAVYFDDAGKPQAIAAGVQEVGDGYTLNLQGVPVEVAAQSILADILKVPYTLDPGASGTITMATGGTVARSELLMVFEEALQANGMVLVSQGEGFQIRLNDGSAVTASQRSEGFGLTAIPLRHLGAERMITLLDGFAAPAGSLRASDGDDMILMRGTARERAAVSDMVASLDVDLMARPNAGIAFLRNANAAAVQADLAQVQESDPQASRWKTQLLERSNALLIQARDREDLNRAMQWITRLDQSGGPDGTDIAVYQVQFARASQLAALLESTFGMGGGAATSNVATTSGNDKAAGAEPTAEAPALPAGGSPSVQAVTAGGGGDVRFTPNDGDNTIIIRAPSPIRQDALSLLATLDKAPVQVLIDVMLIEVTLNDATRMGVQAYLEGSDASVIANAAKTSQISPQFPGFNLVLGNNASPKLIIDALSQVTDVRVVSAPSVAAFENEQAEIKVVEQVPIVTQQVVGTQAADAPVVNSVEYRDAGVILRVTPQVSKTDLVNLQVSQELSAVVGQSDNGATLTPTLRQRSISTRVAVYDKQTVALGGLISTQSTAGKKSNPIFGILGGQKTKDNARTELVVFLTPHVMRDQHDAAAASEELRRKMSLMSGE